MRIVVCLKVVRTKLVDPNESRSEAFTINPYDYGALVDCLKMKKSHGCEIICLSMGAPATKGALLKVLALGADQVILLSDAKFSGADTVATARVLSEAINKIGSVDLVVCGEKSIDGETGQVGFGIGEYLKLPCISQVNEMKDYKENSMILDINDGTNVKKISVQVPFLLSYGEFKLDKVNVSLLSLKKAKKKGIKIWSLENLAIDPELCGIKGSKTKVWCIEKEKVQKERLKVEGTVGEKVDYLITKLTKVERSRHV